MVQTLFTVCNVFALIGWILLIVAPRWRGTDRLVLSGFWSLMLSVGYLVLLLIYFPGAEGGFDSISAVATLFRNEWLLLAGWVHYAAFDLLVGALEVKQGRAAGISHMLLVPVLIVTLVFGPVGLLLFFIVKSARLRRIAEVM